MNKAAATIAAAGLAVGLLTGCGGQQGCPQSLGDGIQLVSVVEKGGGGGGHASGGGSHAGTSGGSKAGTGSGARAGASAGRPAPPRIAPPLIARPYVYTPGVPRASTFPYWLYFHGGYSGQGACR